jgi:Fe-S cluster biogenesis protein NfuA
MDTDAVASAVAEITQIVQADGGDLVLVDADPATLRIRVRLEVAGAECAECILPPAALADTIRAAIERRVPGEFELVVEDPRA